MQTTYLILAVVLIGSSLLIYNSLVRLREKGDAAWADIDVQLKRRHDLVPNLVETVKGYASHERNALEAVISARNRALGATAGSPEERGAAEGALTGALSRLFALSEAYPELRASEGFRDLQRSLGGLEDGIQNARRYYNAVARDYNTRVRQAPMNLVARTFGFSPREFFELPEEERAAPRVDFS